MRSVRRQAPRLVQRVDELVRLSRGRRVLHLGCTAWPYAAEAQRDGQLLHGRLVEVADEVWGVDTDEAGLAQLGDLGYEHLVHLDLERLADLEVATPFDVIVAGEVLEHLSNPGALLAGAARLLADGGRLLVTVPNAYCAMRFAQYALRGRGGLAEPVHPDHVAYYSAATVRLLVERAGFTVDELCFYDLGPEHRPSVRRSLRLVNDLGVRFTPQLADGVLVECSVSAGHR